MCLPLHSELLHIVYTTSEGVIYLGSYEPDAFTGWVLCIHLIVNNICTLHCGFMHAMCLPLLSELLHIVSITNERVQFLAIYEPDAFTGRVNCIYLIGYEYLFVALLFHACNCFRIVFACWRQAPTVTSPRWKSWTGVLYCLCLPRSTNTMCVAH
jgi:succinate dehydrogenase/fumarate reductase cytochrome b subunit